MGYGLWVEFKKYELMIELRVRYGVLRTEFSIRNS